MVGTWSMDVIIMNNFILNANVWRMTFEEEIEKAETGGMEEKIVEKYGLVNQKLKNPQPIMLDKRIINEKVNLMTYGRTKWNFKHSLTQNSNMIKVCRW